MDTFEKADQQLEQDIAHSKDAPAENTSSKAESQPSVVELDKLEKFTYGGKEWTPKELQNAIMMQSDYTKKTQSLAEEKRFTDNLQTDLAAVRSNPDLAAKFKEIYPEKYHGFLDYVMQRQEMKDQGQKQEVPYEFMSRVEKLEQTLFQKDVEAAEAQIDSIVGDLSKKYPDADQRLVLAEVQRQYKPGSQFTKENWEQVFKQEQARFDKMFESKYQAKVKEQKEASRKSRDIGTGGSPTGSPGKKMGFDEITQHLVNQQRQGLQI